MRSVLGVHWKDWCWSWNSYNLASSCEELTHWKRPDAVRDWGAGGKGDNRGWDGWMASPTRWTWVWVNSGSWWWTGRPGVLWFMGLQRVGHDWVTELKGGILIVCPASPMCTCSTQWLVLPKVKPSSRTLVSVHWMNKGPTFGWDGHRWLNSFLKPSGYWVGSPRRGGSCSGKQQPPHGAEVWSHLLYNWQWATRTQGPRAWPGHKTASPLESWALWAGLCHFLLFPAWSLASNQAPTAFSEQGTFCDFCMF